MNDAKAYKPGSKVHWDEAANQEILLNAELGDVFIAVVAVCDTATKIAIVEKIPRGTPRF